MNNNNENQQCQQCQCQQENGFSKSGPGRFLKETENTKISNGQAELYKGASIQYAGQDIQSGIFWGAAQIADGFKKSAIYGGLSLVAAALILALSRNND